MKKVILFVILFGCGLGGLNTKAYGADFIANPQKVVAGDDYEAPSGTDVKIIEVPSRKNFLEFELENRVMVHDPEGQDTDMALFYSRENAVLTNRMAAINIFRQVFKFNELLTLSRKGDRINRCLSIYIRFNPQGKVFDMVFSFFSYGDPDVKRIFTPARLTTLYKKLQAAMQYKMEHLDPPFSYYVVGFNISFDEVLQGKPILTEK